MSGQVMKIAKNTPAPVLNSVVQFNPDESTVNYKPMPIQ